MSPQFPPSTLAGVHRGRHLAKHLPVHGWRPIVVRVHERYYTEVPDPALARLVPDTVEQVRTAAIPQQIARMIGVGDIGLRAFANLGGAIEALARKEAVKAVLITGAPFYPMLLARRINRRLKLPVVLDFQDPWVSMQGAMRPFLSKGRMAHRLSVALEPEAVRNASWITSVSDTQNAEMAARYPWLNASRMTAIPIGGDPDDFEALRQAPPKNPMVRLDFAKINLCYVGTFLPRAVPVVRTLFSAVALLIKERPGIAARLRLVFVGTSNQPPSSIARQSAHLVSPLAREAGVGHLVYEYPARVPFLEALGLLANADGLLLLGSDEPHYTASKIYPALMSARPFLSIFHNQSSAHQILSSAGGGISLAFSAPAELPHLVPTIAKALERLASSPDTLGRPNVSAFHEYTAASIARKFASVFDAAATA